MGNGLVFYRAGRRAGPADAPVACWLSVPGTQRCACRRASAHTGDSRAYRRRYYGTYARPLALLRRSSRYSCSATLASSTRNSLSNLSSNPTAADRLSGRSSDSKHAPVASDGSVRSIASPYSAVPLLSPLQRRPLHSPCCHHLVEWQWTGTALRAHVRSGRFM